MRREITCARVFLSDGHMAMGEDNSLVRVGLCPHCDKTHIWLTISGLDVSVLLDPKQAEEMGRQLISPEPQSDVTLVKVDGL